LGFALPEPNALVLVELAEAVLQVLRAEPADAAPLQFGRKRLLDRAQQAFGAEAGMGSLPAGLSVSLEPALRLRAEWRV
jgi:hypothetical protein